MIDERRELYRLNALCAAKLTVQFKRYLA